MKLDSIDKEKLKKIAILSSIFIFLLSLLFSVSLLSFFKNATLKRVALKILSSSTIPNEYQNIQNIELCKKYTSLSFPHVFEGNVEGSGKMYLFFTRLTGKYGVYQGLFLYDERKMEVLFLGLAVEDFKKTPSYYGINQGIINYWCKKIKSSVY